MPVPAGTFCRPLLKRQNEKCFPFCWYVLLGTLCQYQGAPTLCQRSPGQETRMCSPLFRWDAERETEWKPIWNHLYHHQMWENEMYTKGFQHICWYSSWDSKASRSIWNQVLEIPLGTVCICFSLYISSFPAPSGTAFFASQVWGWVGNDHPCLLVFTCFLVNTATRLNQKAFVPSPNSLKTNLVQLGSDIYCWSDIFETMEHSRVAN